MIKIRKIKNPNLKGKEFTDDRFIRFLEEALIAIDIGTSAKLISQALTYKNIGFKKCTDCKKFYDKCECELCDDCSTNYCTCNLETLKQSRLYIVRLALNHLSKNQLESFHDYVANLNLKDKKYNDALKLLNKSII